MPLIIIIIIIIIIIGIMCGVKRRTIIALFGYKVYQFGLRYYPHNH